MNKHENDDKPMFSGPVNSGGSEIKLDSLEHKKFNSDNRRKNKILDFGMSAVKWVLLSVGVLLILDIVVQLLNLNNELIKECFSILKYSLTTVLGFIFASTKSK